METLSFFRCVEDHWPSHFIYSVFILRIVIVSAIDSSAGLGFSVTTHEERSTFRHGAKKKPKPAKLAHQSVKANSRDFMVSI